MEQRNLELMEVMYSLHRQELEFSQRLFEIPGQYSTPIGASTLGSTLSLIDRLVSHIIKNKCTCKLFNN